jgi:hypothetical protein
MYSQRRREMDFVESTQRDGIATVMLRRGKVNALNSTVVDQIGYLVLGCYVEQLGAH